MEFLLLLERERELERCRGIVMKNELFKEGRKVPTTAQKGDEKSGTMNL